MLNRNDKITQFYVSWTFEEKQRQHIKDVFARIRVILGIHRDVYDRDLAPFVESDFQSIVARFGLEPEPKHHHSVPEELFFNGSAFAAWWKAVHFMFKARNATAVTQPMLYATIVNNDNARQEKIALFDEKSTTPFFRFDFAQQIETLMQQRDRMNGSPRKKQRRLSKV